jgi:eukaryotic-like serine/threonine-protein kinase
MATVVIENWQGVQPPPERVFSLAPVKEKGRAKRVLALVGAGVAAVVLLAGAVLGGVMIARNQDAQVVAADTPAGEETGGDRSSGPGNEEPKASESPSADPSDDPSEEDDGGSEEGGDAGTPATSSGLVGAGVSASGARPPGDHVIAFQPDGGAGVYARLDGATVVCAWSFCQSQGGNVGNGSAGSVSSSPSALTGYANQGGRTVKAEVTYTTAADGTVTITRLVEHHRTSGTGTPPW